MIKNKNFGLIAGSFLLITVVFYLFYSINNKNNFLINYEKPKASVPIYSSQPLAIVGDLQRTSFYELLIGREQNDSERTKIVYAIADENPAAFVILGDMVFDGSNSKDWEIFNSLIKPITKKNIPIFPVIGNHDYWGNNNKAMRNLAKQFPVFLSTHWYTQIYDSLALIFLDSNESDLTETGWKLEHDWLIKTVSIFDTSEEIKGIIIFDHHPPYTNSTVTSDEVNIQNNFLPAYYNSKKCILFISGHAHTYEHFFIKDKNFIVSGGGGGPRVKLKSGNDAHKDLYTGVSPRPFNYLLINKEPDGIKVIVKGLNKGRSKFFTMAEFKILFNKEN